LAIAEKKILVELHRWGLHMAEYGRLSVLSQLAVLQHYGAPTRLVDVTFNPWIGLWFAVEERWQNGKKLDDRDVRLLAIDVTDRLINEDPESRKWEDNLHRPWPDPTGSESDDEEKQVYKEWITSVRAWRPPHFHPRIAAQNGGFLVGGVPGSGVMHWPKTSTASDGNWKIDDVRRVTSVALRVHSLDAAGRGLKSGCVYTIRIKKEAVPEIRKKLQSLFGYRHSTIYPDFTGFAQFGTQDLVSSKP